ncbi:MAG: exosortase/archaeosortase family protein, partial [Blastochloris sp.]|nr:exosortase/archaeosortase family protein [Blastochloris sp.]
MATRLQEREWGVVAVLALLWFLLFQQLQVEWSINPQYSYGWLMPLLGGYLLWRRWETRPEEGRVSGRVWVLGLLILVPVLWLPGRLVQEANPDWRLVSWWLAACVWTLTLGGLYLRGGWAWLRHFWFPFTFLLLAVPWPTVWEQAVIQG